jgi:hypothetical protein
MKFTTVFAALTLCALSGAAFAQAPSLAALLQAADANGDGNVTRAEYDAAIGARFAAQDANHDGALQAGEWTLPPGVPASMSPDTNGDGVVERPEYDAGTTARFQHMDANGDGQISASEIPH